MFPDADAKTLLGIVEAREREISHKMVIYRDALQVAVDALKFAAPGDPNSAQALRTIASRLRAAGIALRDR